MSHVKTYLISGIASDERAYFPQHEVIPNFVYLPFPKHDKKDTMESYSQKFLPMIDTSEPFNIIGNSMGGIITMEIIKHVQPEKVILVSSIKSRNEMPFKLKHMKYLNEHKLLPGSGFIKSIEFGSKFIKHVRKTEGLRELAISMAKNNHPSFLYWAVDAIVKWNGKDDYRNDIIHIHGTKDQMFPYKKIKNAIPVFGGTHEMNLIKIDEVNRLIKYYLER
jgi:pimeloyl-ACP methyl ester carboxylesterase